MLCTSLQKLRLDSAITQATKQLNLALFNGGTLNGIETKLNSPAQEPQSSQKSPPFGHINILSDDSLGSFSTAITKFGLRTTSKSPQSESKLRDFEEGIAITKERTKTEKVLFDTASGRELMEAFWATMPAMTNARKAIYQKVTIIKELPFLTYSFLNFSFSSLQVLW